MDRKYYPIVPENMNAAICFCGARTLWRNKIKPWQYVDSVLSEAELFIFMRIPDWPCFIPSLTMHNLQTHPSTFLVVASLYFALPSMLFFKYQLYTTCSLYEWKQTWHLQIKKNFFQVWPLYGYCIIGLVSMLKSEWGWLTHVNPFESW